MVERIEGLPAGVLGFRLVGKLSRDDYQGELIQPILAALERGERLKLLVELPDDFEGLDAGALWEDLKAVGSVGLKHRSGWEKFAVVTDKDWVRHGVSVFGWMSPGELLVFDLGRRDQAELWLTGAPQP